MLAREGALDKAEQSDHIKHLRFMFLNSQIKQNIKSQNTCIYINSNVQSTIQ